jgi:hypothetical protein
VTTIHLNLCGAGSGCWTTISLAAIVFWQATADPRLKKPAGGLVYSEAVT